MNSTVINNVQVTGAGTLGLYYSDQRRQLFAYRINDGNSQLIGIDVVDWQSGAFKNLIPPSALPELFFFDKPSPRTSTSRQASGTLLSATSTGTTPRCSR